MVKSSYESTLINKENYIGHLEIQMQKEINKLNETLEDKCKLIENYEVKILETDKLCEDLRNKYFPKLQNQVKLLPHKQYHLWVH